jgi:hypothetical protein
LTLFKEKFATVIRFLCTAVSGELTHGPEFAPVHVWVDTPSERKLTWIAEITLVIQLG